MKRTLKFALLACMFLLVSAFMFTACYYSPGEAPKFHVKEVIPAVAPTCTEPGLTEGMRCSVCQDIIVAQEFIKPFGHTTVIDNGVAPTCTTTGFTDGEHCSVCGEILKKREIIPTLHTIVIDAAIAPTCTETGLTEGKHCYICNETLVAQTVVDALGHTEVIDSSVSSTCTDTGLTEGKHCSVCNEVLIAQTIVGVLGHNYINNVCDHCGLTNPNYTTKNYVRCDKDGTPNENGDYILFGEYPQTIKADYVSIFPNQDSRGYYLGSDGHYYAKVIASPCNSGYTFSTGATITIAAVYYFKVEPIRWRILSTDGETALILCDSIIANQAYDNYNNGNYSNNYAESDIRAWLNATFYEIAFNELQREIILTTMVDNSVYSTGYSYLPYACEDTEDKIFLLSYREVTNSEYGFSSSYSIDDDIARIVLTSDYSRATGVYMNISSDYYGNGCWWLRSPYSYDSNCARFVYYDGSVYDDSYVYSSSSGVVAALKIRL